MVRISPRLPTRAYEDIVRDHGGDAAAEHLYVRRRADTCHRRLIVIISTHNEGRRFAGLVDAYSLLDADLLFIRDEANSYYLRADRGAAFDALVRTIAEPYAPDQILFFGSSMAGYAALRYALMLDANAVLSNPQVSVTASAPLGWTELRRNIERIAEPHDLGDGEFADRACAITLLHSRHPMDVENTRLFFDLYRRHPGLALLTVHADETDHKYLIPDFQSFLLFVRRTYELRRLRTKVVRWGRVPKNK